MMNNTTGSVIGDVITGMLPNVPDGAILILVSVALVLYVWLWFYDVDTAMRFTMNIGQMVFALVRGILYGAYKLVEGLARGIGNLVSRFGRR